VSNWDYDLFVIGAGSGGVRASRMSARHGARVAVVEGRYLGGTCVNVGCVPKKLFVYGSHYAEDFEDAAAYGWNVGAARFDWPTLRDNKTREIERRRRLPRFARGRRRDHQRLREAARSSRSRSTTVAP
jgi:glutathione reductase (NADPH)